MNAAQRGDGREDQVVQFREWNEVLEAEAMAPALKAVYRQEIVAFLHFCKVHHAGASIMLMKQYLAVAERQGRIQARSTGSTSSPQAGSGQAREALRWWFRAAKGAERNGGGTRAEAPRYDGGLRQGAEGVVSGAPTTEAERLRRPATTESEAGRMAGGKPASPGGAKAGAGGSSSLSAEETRQPGPAHPQEADIR
jgi:hypothetical protein